MSELEATVDASANTARALPKEDPRYTQGCVFIEEGKYDEAIELLNSLMESAAQEYGDKALELAPVWYKYGYALLGKEEESPSDDLMGVARRNMTEAAGLLRSDGADEDKVDEEDEDEEEEAEEGAAAEGEGEEDPSDMDLAWEALEMSRVIYEANASPENDPLLANTYRRLGDLNKHNGDYDAAIIEYQKCLDLRLAFCSDNDRSLAEIHFHLGVVYTYNAHEEGKDTKVLKKKALEHYRASRTVLKAALLVSSEQEKENVADLLDVLDETIAALEKEIKALEPTIASLAAGQSSGFGIPKSSASVFQNPFAKASSLNAASSVPSTSAATSAAETGCTLQIKKKAKLNDSARIASNELKEEVSKKDEKENCDVKDGSNGK